MVANCSLVPIDYQNNNTVFLYTFEVSDASMCGYITYHIVTFISCLLLMLGCCICLPCRHSRSNFECGKLWVLCFACLLLGFEGVPFLLIILIYYDSRQQQTNRINDYAAPQSTTTTTMNVDDTDSIIIDTARVVADDARRRRDAAVASAPSLPSTPRPVTPPIIPAAVEVAIPVSTAPPSMAVQRAIPVSQAFSSALLLATRIESCHLDVMTAALQANKRNAKKIATFRT